MSEELETIYTEASAERVISFFVAGYDRKPFDYEWFYDPHKQKFIFRMYVPKKVVVEPPDINARHPEPPLCP